jgi:hypothetical protein
VLKTSFDPRRQALDQNFGLPEIGGEPELTAGYPSATL